MEVPLDLGDRTDLDRREVELEHQKRVVQRRGVASDVGRAEELVEAVRERDVVVVRQHRADERLAEALRAQENGSPDGLKDANWRRVVHEVAFVYKRGPIDDPVWDYAFGLHGSYHTRGPEGPQARRYFWYRILRNAI